MKKIDLIVVSSYPEKGLIHGQKTVGVASYAKNTLLAFSQAAKTKPKILVLAEKLKNHPGEYREKNIKVKRCWSRNRIFAFGQIFREIKKYPNKNILIEFEMAMFGAPLINFFFPLFLAAIRFSGKKPMVVIHQVVLDFSALSGHLGEKKESLRPKIISFFAKIFFWLVVKLSCQIIVFEKFIKDRLGQIVKSEKIIVIPHGVENYQIKVAPDQAKKELGFKQGDFVLAIFGFLAWYKGTDWLIDAFADYLKENKNTSFKLMVAGGPNPNHLNKSYYLEYLRQIEQMVKKHPRQIKLTGFIPEEKISFYYQASDLLIFPYRTSLSSSGPLAMAFTNKRPFLISLPLADLLKSEDLTDCLKKLSLDQKELNFSLEKKLFWKKVEELQKNPLKRAKIAKLGKEIAFKRQWLKIGRAYARILKGE